MPRSAPSCAGFCISGDGGGIQWAEVMNMHLLSLAPPETRSDTPRLVLTGREELLIEQHAGLFPMKPGASGEEPARACVQSRGKTWLSRGSACGIC